MAPQRSWLSQRGVELNLAFSFLTRLPMPRLGDVADVRQAQCVWAYPLVGVAVGLIGGFALIAASLGRWPEIVDITVAVAVTVWITGALHEDGLADFADGVGGGRNREQKLSIMRDSRIGTYGVLALILALLFRITLLTGLSAPIAALMLVFVHTLSRTALILPFLLLRPARPDGLAASAGRPGLISVLAAVAIAIVAPTLLVALAVGIDRVPVLSMLTASIAATITVLIICRIAYRHLGGHTGDVFGAAEQAAEIAALFAIVTFMSW